MKKTVHRYMREDYFLSLKDRFYTRFEGLFLYKRAYRKVTSRRKFFFSAYLSGITFYLLQSAQK